MAWSWSHTQEAYAACRDNLMCYTPKGTLNVIFAEWEAHKKPDDGDDENFDVAEYHAALKKARRTARAELADHIWERMEEQATCTNGGHQAWACPFGCHEISFDWHSAKRQEQAWRGEV